MARIFCLEGEEFLHRNISMLVHPLTYISLIHVKNNVPEILVVANLIQ